jgi:hypothetical protein
MMPTSAASMLHSSMKSVTIESKAPIDGTGRPLIGMAANAVFAPKAHKTTASVLRMRWWSVWFFVVLNEDGNRGDSSRRDERK